MPQTLKDQADPLYQAGQTQEALLKLFSGGGAPMHKRLLGLLIFLGLIVAFRHLALIGVTFVIFARVLSFLGERVGHLVRRTDRQGVLIVLLLGALLLGLSIFLFVHFGGRSFQRYMALHLQEGKTFQELFQQMHEDMMRHLPAWLPLEGLREQVPHMVQPAVEYLRATGRMLLHMLIGFILAVIYVLDRQPVEQLVGDLDEHSVLGSVRRYFGYLAEAIIITITLQVLVALVNTALTLPVLLFFRLPHILAFTAVIFLSSLVPVVGNLVSGAVLMIASYVYRGILATTLFVITTFILHKIEAYYLNPRLASRHVNLPALILIISLILHEHVFGLVGLFLSFPVLYVGMNVIRDLRQPSAPAVVGLPPAES